MRIDTCIKDNRYRKTEMAQRIENPEDFSLQNEVKRMKTTEVIIIDEISMISREVFEKIDVACRCAKGEKKYPFGGIQVILTGDFRQLPPVANTSIGDNGDYAFTSPVFKQAITHHVLLSEIHRQTEPDLITAVWELQTGQLSQDTIHLLQRMRRPLPPGEPPIHIYARNFDVDLWNHECFMKLPGETNKYEATDVGNMNRYDGNAKKTLHLKIDAKVMLIQNLSPSLVNGKLGVIKRMEESKVGVLFDGMTCITMVQKTRFSTFCQRTKKDVASRLQVPLRLAYAITVHKAQGLTMDRVFVDCRHMHQPGQIAVAVGRVTAKKGLRVIHFDPNNIPKQHSEVAAFEQSESKRLMEDKMCCKDVFAIDSDMDKEDIVADVLTDPLLLRDNMDDSDSALIDIAIEGGAPDDFDIIEVVRSFKFENPETENQESLNTAVEFLLGQPDKTCQVVSFLWKSLEDHFDPTTAKDSKSFYVFFNDFLQSKMYICHLANLFGLRTTNLIQPQQSNLMLKIATVVRRELLHRATKSEENKAAEATASAPGKVFSNDTGGRGKIRYIGGWCVATLLYKKRKSIHFRLFKDNTNVFDTLCLEVRLLEQLVVSHVYLEATAEDKASLEETRRKQNIRNSLTNISDATYSFFMSLDAMIRKMETTSVIAMQGPQFAENVLQTLLADLQLKNFWYQLFRLTGDDDEELYQMAVLDEILKEVLKKYTNMATKQLTKDFLREKKTEKEIAHRKQIKIAGKKRKLKEFSMSNIRDDSSLNRLASHRRLQSEVTKEGSYLEGRFKRAELAELAQMYHIEAPKKKSKGEIATALTLAITNLDNMPSGEVVPPASLWPCGVCHKTCADGAIACDRCEVWSHFACVKVQEGAIAEDQPWLCHGCAME